MHPKFIADTDDDVWVLENEAVESNPSYVRDGNYVQTLQFIQENYGPVRELVPGNELKSPPKKVGDAVEIQFDGPLYGKVAGVVEHSDGQYTYSIKLEIAEDHVK